MDLENQLRAKIDSLEAQIFNLEQDGESVKSENGQKIVSHSQTNNKWNWKTL